MNKILEPILKYDKANLVYEEKKKEKEIKDFMKNFEYELEHFLPMSMKCNYYMNL